MDKFLQLLISGYVVLTILDLAYAYHKSSERDSFFGIFIRNNVFSIATLAIAYLGFRILS